MPRSRGGSCGDGDDDYGGNHGHDHDHGHDHEDDDEHEDDGEGGNGNGMTRIASHRAGPLNATNAKITCIGIVTFDQATGRNWGRERAGR
eukprot:gene5580-4286_t